ncbi:L-aspartate oxidase, partial [Pluralibacter gergoviae]
RAATAIAAFCTPPMPPAKRSKQPWSVKPPAIRIFAFWNAATPLT